MTIYAKLLRLPFFQGIDRDELEAMASKIRFDFQKYDEGAWIARENDRCATLTLVMTGSVEAEAISADHSYSLRELIDAPCAIGTDLRTPATPGTRLPGHHSLQRPATAEGRRAATLCAEPRLRAQCPQHDQHFCPASRIGFLAHAAHDHSPQDRHLRGPPQSPACWPQDALHPLDRPGICHRRVAPQCLAIPSWPRSPGLGSARPTDHHHPPPGAVALRGRRRSSSFGFSRKTP